MNGKMCLRFFDVDRSIRTFFAFIAESPHVRECIFVAAPGHEL